MTRKVEKNNTASNLSKKTSLEALSFFPINTFQVGSCLFWATVLAYLTDLKSDKQLFSQDEYDLQFHLACTTLFGEVGDSDEKKLKRLVDQFHVTQDLTFIYRSGLLQDLIFVFRQRVVDYIDQHRDVFQIFINTKIDSYLYSMRLATKFAGSVEIEAMVALVGCSIEVIDINSHLTFLYPSINDSGDRENIFLIQTRTLHLFFDPTKQYYYFGLAKLEKLTTPGFVKQEVKTNDKVKNIKKAQSLFYVDVPRDHSCLFWAAAIAYLVSMRGEQFEEACKTLFGSFSATLEDIKEEIIGFNSQSLKNIQKNSAFVNLVRINFRQQVVRYMSLHRNEFEFETDDIEGYLAQMLFPTTWGSWQEVKAISALLKCKISLFLSWDRDLQKPLSFGVHNPILYLFYDNVDRHYYFGLLEKEIKTHENNFKEISGFGLSGVPNKKSVSRKKLRTSKTTTISKTLKQSLFNDLIEGISIGLFLETSLWILASTPFFKFFIFDKNNEFYNDLKFTKLIESPYLYFQTYQEFLLKSTEFDNFLNNLFDKKRPFVWGIVLGMVGGLIKYFINPEDTEKFLIIMGIFMSVLPSDYLNKNLEAAQLLFRCMLMLFLSLNGLLSTIDFAVPYVKKISDSTSSSVKKLSNKIPSFFAKKEEENKVMDSEFSLQHGTRASL